MTMEKFRMQTVNERISMIRKHKSLTQKAFSEELNFPRTSYCEIENGNRCPNVELVSSIASTFKDISLGWLLTGEGEMLSYDGIADSNTLSITKEEEKMITLYRRCSVEQKKDIVKDAEKYARHSDSIEQEIIKKIIAGKIDLKKLTK